jgi:hypothetical protein
MSLYIADTQRAGGKVGHRSASGRGGDNHSPIQQRVKFPRGDLDGDQEQQGGEKIAMLTR